MSHFKPSISICFFISFFWGLCIQPAFGQGGPNHRAGHLKSGNPQGILSKLSARTKKALNSNCRTCIWMSYEKDGPVYPFEMLLYTPVGLSTEEIVYREHRPEISTGFEGHYDIKVLLDSKGRMIKVGTGMMSYNAERTQFVDRAFRSIIATLTSPVPIEMRKQSNGAKVTFDFMKFKFPKKNVEGEDVYIYTFPFIKASDLGAINTVHFEEENRNMFWYGKQELPVRLIYDVKKYLFKGE